MTAWKKKTPQFLLCDGPKRIKKVHSVGGREQKNTTQTNGPRACTKKKGGGGETTTHPLHCLPTGKVRLLCTIT